MDNDYLIKWIRCMDVNVDVWVFVKIGRYD